MSQPVAELEQAEERRLEALEAARACSALLRERFGVRRVILFGSLAGQGPWHSRSDLDLAVEGLADEDLFSAYAACRDLLPPDLELDLVQMEGASPELRARILGAKAMAEDRYQALAELIEDELAALKPIVERTQEALSVLADEPGQLELHGLAAYLHQFYTGIENIFERIAVWLDGELPKGASWHQSLLDQMAEAREGVRPAVVDSALRDKLEEYLKFRHFFRHAYGYTLKWARIRPLAQEMAETVEALQAQVVVFLQSVREA